MPTAELILDGSIAHRVSYARNIVHAFCRTLYFDDTPVNFKATPFILTTFSYLCWNLLKDRLLSCTKFWVLRRMYQIAFVRKFCERPRSKLCFVKIIFCKWQDKKFRKWNFWECHKFYKDLMLSTLAMTVMHSILSQKEIMFFA